MAHRYNKDDIPPWTPVRISNFYVGWLRDGFFKVRVGIEFVSQISKPLAVFVGLRHKSTYQRDWLPSR